MADAAPFLAYRFTLDNGVVHEFPVRLGPETLDAVPRQREAYPDWTRLSFCRCPICPFDEAVRPRCPIAENVIDIVEAFKDSLSTDMALVEVVREARTVSKRTSLASGVSALLGVLMPTSGCPILGKLKPNVLTHLPFATIEETIFRTLAMYLLAQFFAQRRGDQPDWKLERFAKVIGDVHAVNMCFCKRFFLTCLKDVNSNALIHLDSLGELTAMATQRSHVRLDQMAKMFDAYWRP